MVIAVAVLSQGQARGSQGLAGWSVGRFFGQVLGDWFGNDVTALPRSRAAGFSMTESG